MTLSTLTAALIETACRVSIVLNASHTMTLSVIIKTATSAGL